MIVIVGDISAADLAQITLRAQNLGIKDEIVHASTTEEANKILVVEDREIPKWEHYDHYVREIKLIEEVFPKQAREDTFIPRKKDDGPRWRKHDNRKWNR